MLTNGFSSGSGGGFALLRCCYAVVLSLPDGMSRFRCVGFTIARD